MTPEEMREEREEQLKEFHALKTIFGGLLLENNGWTDPDDVAYYQRKFKEAQQRLRR